MADDQDTPEVAAIVSNIKSWLSQNQNKLNFDLSKNPVAFKQSGNQFHSNDPQVSITLGFKDENLTKNSSLEQFSSGFNYIALDRLPTPGLQGVPSQWQIYPQTPISSFSEGVTFEQYDPNTQVLQLNIKTGFFAIYGTIPQEHPLMDAPSPKGTYLQVRQDIQGDIKLSAKLAFN